jgi:hypothetical protein
MLISQTRLCQHGLSGVFFDFVRLKMREESPCYAGLLNSVKIFKAKGRPLEDRPSRLAHFILFRLRRGEMVQPWHSG